MEMRFLKTTRHDMISVAAPIYCSGVDYLEIERLRSQSVKEEEIQSSWVPRGPSLSSRVAQWPGSAGILTGLP